LSVPKAPGSNIEWKRWGRKDPLFGVAATKGKERGGAAPWTDEEFFATGQRDWAAAYPRWRRYGLDPSTCVEVGCGAGRITAQLAATFSRVHAIDVSEDMIAYARERIVADHVSFHLTDGNEFPLPNAVATAVFSTHVFQHFDSASHIQKYFSESARILAPGGTLMIHLPVHRWPATPNVLRGLYHLQKRAGDLRAWAHRRLITAGLASPIMRYLSSDVDELFDGVSRHGLGDLEIAMFKPASGVSIHPFLFARKT
jgi:SAM-dependent methyltransferase